MGVTLGATMLGCSSVTGGESGPGQVADDLLRISIQAQLAQIRNFVVLCMENRSFDHYLGSRQFLEGQALNGLTGDETNPTSTGSLVPVFNLDAFSIPDPPHEWDNCHLQWDGGKNDGFVISDSDQSEPMGYYVRSQLPITYALADAYTICDAYSCSVLGPTWPNRFYLHGATSDGVKDATPIPGFRSIFDLLDAAGVSNLNYFSDVPWATGAYFKTTGLAPLAVFFAQAAAGTLPQFSIIDPQFFGPTANDDHPDHDIRLGQALIATIYNALANSPQWNRTLFLITYDEHGGFFDDAPPPPTVDALPDFAQLGFRVPALAIGPYVRRSAVVSTTLEHVSVIKTLTNRYDLPVLNQRVAATNDLTSVFDPNFFRNPQPPVALAPIELSQSMLAAQIASAQGTTDTSHPELAAAIARGDVPASLDLRSSGLGSMADVLEWGTRLGAIRLGP